MHLSILFDLRPPPLLDRAGLELLAVHGDLDGGPLELDSGFVVTLSGRAGSGLLAGG